VETHPIATQGIYADAGHYNEVEDDKAVKFSNTLYEVPPPPKTLSEAAFQPEPDFHSAAA